MNATIIDVKIREAVVRRAKRLNFNKVYELLENRPFILAGGSLSGDAVHDFDVYPDAERPFTLDDVLDSRRAANNIEVSLVAHTRNAVTLLLPAGQTVQFCAYRKPSLPALVGSFDFSHVQVGVRFRGDGQPPQPQDVYYTDEFVVANMTRQSTYTHSEYPTSSIVRTLKYYKRGKMARPTAARSVLRAMADVVQRGFKDYADFKDQLDAIDLGMPDCMEARLLWEAACGAKLVGNPTCTEHAE